MNLIKSAGRNVSPTESLPQAARPIAEILPTTSHFKRFNRKLPATSTLMLPSDGQHYYCAWISDSITIHSDGNVTCGVDDPNGLRSFGNIYSQPIEEIWRNPEYQALRENLWRGQRCNHCGLSVHVTEGFQKGPPQRVDLPHNLVVESTNRCNIRCRNDPCFANNDKAEITRDADMLPMSAFALIVQQLKHCLRTVYFFNYGEPFVNPQAEDMLMYLRQTCPDVTILTSTNGTPLARFDRAEKVVLARTNRMTFTISGVTQESYSRYHGRGSIDRAILGMRNIIDAKRKFDVAEPFVEWRYLLFRWNDGDDEIASAISCAEEWGVDRLTLYLTAMPESGKSFRFAPGTPNFHRFTKYIECGFGYEKDSRLPKPDDCGFFGDEEIGELGKARWTSWRAVINFDRSAERIELSFSTNRPRARETQSFVFLATPWRTYKIPLLYMRWQDVSIRIPNEYRLGHIQINIMCPDYWFPAGELNSADLRCLGILVSREFRAGGDKPLRSRDLPPLSDEDWGQLKALPPTDCQPLHHPPRMIA